MLVGTNYRINPAYFVNYKTYENQSEAERREQEQEKNRGVIKEVNGKQKLTHYNLSTFQK